MARGPRATVQGRGVDPPVQGASDEPGQPQACEGLRAAHREGDDRAQIRAVPLFAHDVNFGDEVSVVPSAEGPLVATGSYASCSA